MKGVYFKFLFLITGLALHACATDNGQQKNMPVQNPQASGADSDEHKVELDETAIAPFSKKSEINKSALNSSQAYNLISQNGLNLAASNGLSMNILVNGQNGSVNLTTHDSIEVAINLDPRSEQFYGEIFVLFSKKDGSGVQYYCSNKWCSGVGSSYTGGLFTLKKTIGFSSPLAKGEYTASFIIDKYPNNKIDLDKSYVKSTQITVK